MEFAYISELFSSWKLLWNKQSVFWGFVVTVLVFFSFSVILLGTALPDSYEIFSETDFTSMENYSLSANIDFIGYFLLIIVLYVFFAGYLSAATYNISRKLIENKDVGFSSVITEGKNNYWKYLAVSLIASIISIVINSIISIGGDNAFVDFLSFLISLVISYYLLFALPAVAYNRGPITAVKESFIKAKNDSNHVIKTYATYLISALSIAIIAGIFIGVFSYLGFMSVQENISNILMIFPIISLVIIVALFFYFGLSIYLVKAYSKTLKPAK